jgi:hypothetical protein
MKSLSTREKIYVGILILALFWGAWNYRHVFMGPPASTHGQEPTVSVAAVTVSERIMNSTRFDSGSQRVPDWGPDPFHRSWRGSNATAAPATAAKGRPARAALKLSAVVVRPDGRYAVINGGIVREGGMVAGRRVVKIESSRVVVDDNGTEVTLSL